MQRHAILHPLSPEILTFHYLVQQQYKLLSSYTITDCIPSAFLYNFDVLSYIIHLWK